MLKVAIIYVILLIWTLTECCYCGANRGLTYLSIPKAMSLLDFRRHFANKTLAEMYFAVPIPPSFVTDVNYFASFSYVSNNSYRYDTYAETVTTPANPNSTCVRSSSTLSLVPSANTAMFFKSGTNQMIVFWSSCPSSYLWSIKCIGWFAGLNICPLRSIALGLYIHGTPDNLPLDGALKDLRLTGATFGITDLTWSFTYGKNTLCSI